MANVDRAEGSKLPRAVRETYKDMDGPLRVEIKNQIRHVRLGGRYYTANQFRTLCYAGGRCFSCGGRHQIANCPRLDRPLFPNATKYTGPTQGETTSAKGIPVRPWPKGDVTAIEEEWEDGIYIYTRDTDDEDYTSQGESDSTRRRISTSRRPRVNTPSVSENSTSESDEESWEIAALEVVSSREKSSINPMEAGLFMTTTTADVGVQTDPVWPENVPSEGEITSVGIKNATGTIVEGVFDNVATGEEEREKLPEAADQRPMTFRNQPVEDPGGFNSRDILIDDPVAGDGYLAPMRMDAVESRQYICLHVDGKEMIGMPDTGSTVNFMPIALYMRDFSHLPLRQRNRHRFLGVTDTDKKRGADATGVVQLRVNFGGKTLCSNFLVGKSHNETVLNLGQSWQDEMMLNVGYDLRGKRVVYMDHHIVPSFILGKGQLVERRAMSIRSGNISVPHAPLRRTSDSAMTLRICQSDSVEYIAEASEERDFTFIPLRSAKVKSGRIWMPRSSGYLGARKRERPVHLLRCFLRQPGWHLRQ